MRCPRRDSILSLLRVLAIASLNPVLGCAATPAQPAPASAAPNPPRSAEPVTPRAPQTRASVGDEIEEVLALPWAVDRRSNLAAVAASESGGGDGGGASAVEEMARKLQDPLANIRALMTDNSIGFNSGTDGGTSFGFQLQPVYAIDFPDRGFTFIPRAVIPIMGLEPGTKVPPVEEPTPAGRSSVWGLGDTVLQALYAPKSNRSWKWGIGPQVSLKTRTDSALGGPGWGAGVAGVVVGSITDDISFAGVVGNLWGGDGDFNLATIQPVVLYNIAAVPGAWVGYNAVISADWNASSGNTWTIPLGLTVGRTFDMGSGNGLDLSVGAYGNVVRPDGAPDWQIRFGVTWVFP